MNVRIQKTQAHFKKLPVAEGPDMGVGEFFLLVDVTADDKAVYVPISIASSKKPAGFVYQIEGTGQGTISTAQISCSGEGVSQVTLGTILYAQIPAGKTATFRILIETGGKLGQTYHIVINRVNYKLDPSDARYQKLPQALASKEVRFG